MADLSFLLFYRQKNKRKCRKCESESLVPVFILFYFTVIRMSFIVGFLVCCSTIDESTNQENYQ